MEGIKLVKKITDLNPKVLRTKEQPKNKWRDKETKDLKKLKLRNSSQLIKDRKGWKDPVQKTNTMLGCSVRSRRRRWRRRMIIIIMMRRRRRRRMRRRRRRRRGRGRRWKRWGVGEGE
jgi:hypothetical protein